MKSVTTSRLLGLNLLATLLVACGGPTLDGLSTGNGSGGDGGGDTESSAGGNGSQNGPNGSSTSGGNGGAAQGTGTGTGATGTTTVTAVAGSTVTSTGSSGNPCGSTPDSDVDADGYTQATGDCNDCDPNTNPDAIEVVVTEPDPDTGEIPDPADEDCDGTIDNPPPATCDTGITLETANALDGARSIELCQEAPAQGGWGVVNAGWVRADGSAAGASTQVGIQSGFGPNVTPRGGSSMLNLSSGRARLPGQPDACGACNCGGAVGVTPDSLSFPQTSPECGGGPGSPVYDDVAFEVRLRAPSNATGYSFEFSFYTFEYPDYICSSVNDQFIAWMQPPPAGVPNGNVSFDATGNPISVNAAFFDVCAGCAQGEGAMEGTGFDDWTCGADDGEAGATGWLRTQAPVVPGEEFTLRFAIWDTGDSILDSTVVIDNFKWIANGGTVDVGTTPGGTN